ncbi:unnamed protein product [Amoebophrya sp. A120]|nr:unnamed protein product [Amoebophrya sp. A120]|eukprot:GSA120T00000618001.1
MRGSSGPPPGRGSSDGRSSKPQRPSDQSRRRERPAITPQDEFPPPGGPSSRSMKPGGSSSRSSPTKYDSNNRSSRAGGRDQQAAPPEVDHYALQASPQLRSSAAPPAADDDDLEVDYDDDFEDASDDDGQTYAPTITQPEVKARPPSAGGMISAVTRPLSAKAPPMMAGSGHQQQQNMNNYRVPAPAAGPVVNDISAIKQAMEQERATAAPTQQALQAAKQQQMLEEQEKQKRFQQMQQAQQAAAINHAKQASIVSGSSSTSYQQREDNYTRQSVISPKSSPPVRPVVLTTTNYTAGVQELSTVEKQQRNKRATELRALIGSKLNVEKHDLFSQRPQRRLEMFLQSRGPYSFAVSKGIQTGEELLEEGAQTEQEIGLDKETQCPMLGGTGSSSSGGVGGGASSTGAGTTNSTSASTDPGQNQGDAAVSTSSGALEQPLEQQARLLPFLRRVFPLVDASLKNKNRNNKGKSGQKQAGLKDGVDASKLVATLTLDLGTPVGAKAISGYLGAPHLLVLFDMASTAWFQSVVAVYPTSGGVPSKDAKPTRVFFSFERITCFDYCSSSTIVVAGTAAGSLLLFDMKTVPKRNVVGTRIAANVEQQAGVQLATSSMKQLTVNGGEQISVEPENPSFSSDIFALQLFDDLDIMDTEDETARPFLAEIASITVTNDLVFCLDIDGAVTTWRILSIKQGETRLVYTGPQKYGKSGAGSTKVVAIPREISPHNVAAYLTLGCTSAEIRVTSSSFAGSGTGSSFASQFNLTDLLSANSSNLIPNNCCFHPFLPSLFLVCYLSGDLALFNMTLGVPIMHWPASSSSSSSGAGRGQVAGASRHTATCLDVTWSTVRPTVFFVLTLEAVEVWDLALNSSQAMKTITFLPISKFTSPLQNWCLSVLPESGLPVVCCSCTGGKNYSKGTTRQNLQDAQQGSFAGRVFVLQLEEQFVNPLSAYPAEKPHLQNNKLFDSSNNLFDARNKDALAYMRKVLDGKNKSTNLEIDILHKVLLTA